VKQGLRATVIASLIATSATRLAGVAWVDALDTNTVFLGFVESKAVELRKTPTMQATFRVSVLSVLATPHLGVFTNIGQVLKDNRCAWLGMLDDMFGENVVAIPVESHLLLTHLFQVAFGTFCSFGLQFAAETETAAVNLFPVATAEKLTGRSHGGSVQSEVYPDNFFARGDNRFRDGNYHMQPPFAFVTQEISRCYLAPDVLCAIVGNRKGDAHLPCARRETNLLHAPFEGIGMHVITRGARLRLRHLDRLEDGRRFALLESLRCSFGGSNLFLSFPRERTFEGFSRLDTCLNEQIRYQTRAGCFRLVVRRMMQLDPVLFSVLPAIATYCIERFVMLSLVPGGRVPPPRTTSRCWVMPNMC
jgi:hypothetical protein